MRERVNSIYLVEPRPLGTAKMNDRRSARRVAMSGGIGIHITEPVRKYAAEQGIAEEEALTKGMEEKSKEFVEKGAEVYAKA
jgi:phosphomethylpyrimidine synthase